jgi:hypothetical protein
VIQAGRPKNQKETLDRKPIQKVVGILAVVCAACFVPLCLAACLAEFVGWRGAATALAVFSILPFLMSPSFGIWWLVLETKRCQNEQELNREYEDEVAQLKAKAGRQLDQWKAQLASQQAEARKRHEKESTRWREAVAAAQAEVKRQREHWQRQLKSQQAEARRKFDEEMARWAWAVAAIEAEGQRRRQAAEEARRRADAAEQNWRAVADKVSKNFDKKKADLQTLRDGHNRLAAGYATERQQLQARAREMQLQQFLQLTFIPDNEISKIGPGRAATLASYGIETALDIVESEVRNVPGFGPVLNSSPDKGK